MVISFGDSVSYKSGGWSGGRGDLHPNELMHWTAMCWAKRSGYRYYDFEGIDDARPAGDTRSVSSFKLGFGGAVVQSPGPYELVTNRILRRAYDGMFRHLLGSGPGRWAVDTIRTR